ncbi:MAG: riboflavin synthase [Planctomycetota bacterium]
MGLGAVKAGERRATTAFWGGAPAGTAWTGSWLPKDAVMLVRTRPAPQSPQPSNLMFTGLVQAMGSVTARTEVPGGLRLFVDISALPGTFRIGDSIALSGACCTVVTQESGVAEFFLTQETIDCTWLAKAQVGQALNLEGALRAGEPLGGHIVQGHVDGVGELTGAIDPQEGGDLWARIPDSLQRYCVEKGSVTLDGVSLTIAGQKDGAVRIAVIPHTAQQTSLGSRVVGDSVHVEVDVLAKYVESMLAQRGLT